MVSLDEEVITVTAGVKERSGDVAIILVSMQIKEGWFVRGVAEDDHVSEFQLDVRGDDVVETLGVEYPTAYHIDILGDDPEIIYWQGSVEFPVRVKVKGSASEMRAVLTYQPCTVGKCLAIKHLAVKVG